MILLILGVALWWGAHLFKRVAPAQRAAMGAKGKGVVALALAVSILLMIFGYKAANGAVFWGRHPATVGINNLMMLVALYLTSPGPKKGALLYRMRHPMLTGFLLWTVAHLLVNGDVPSFVLFGGLGLWAITEIIVINRAEPGWTPPAKGSIAKDAMFAAISVVLLLVIGLIHTSLGYPTFG
ncbi:NnrU family protein [Salipiger sp. 1_MG-2023]|uniref:NnrU family protein n=1 Tax=Salipiger sp. 1_MG-2023 TaxID=3062665 RepID=UPI0026E2DC77|nr:NnrU family protein [Salipiger sp. 1_MG-2023]MDO6584403.1 NnrU family protein [Salipiger sp. 1_MG-2023]